MKKIVALVLSLVMALSLCTVAFGATIEANEKLPNGKIGAWQADVKKVAAKKPAGQEWGWIEYYAGKDAAAGIYYIPCDKDDADVAIYTNHGFTVWAKSTTNSGDAAYEFEVTAQKATDKPATCTKGHFLDDGYLDKDGYFYVGKDDAFAGADSYVVKYGNKIITVYDGYSYLNYVPASHIFGEAKANDKTGYDEVTCLVCKGVFAATNDQAVLTKNKVAVKATFEYSMDDAKAVYDDNDYSWNWGDKFADSYDYVWSLKAGTAAGTKDGVNSAKTFDAGIAMYVGMSLLSVAGGAVVIGKKKEF